MNLKTLILLVAGLPSCVSTDGAIISFEYTLPDGKTVVRVQRQFRQVPLPAYAEPLPQPSADLFPAVEPQK
jgi:hypothetical protein